MIGGYILGIIFSYIYIKILKCYGKYDRRTKDYHNYKIKRWIYIIIILFNLVPYFGYFIMLCGPLLLVIVIDDQELMFIGNNKVLDWLNKRI